MSERSLVLICGLLGAGKSSVVNKLAHGHGYESRSVGDELARIYRLDNELAPDAPVPGMERMKTHKKVRQTDPTYFSRFILGGDYNRRVVDGLRNYNDAVDLVKAGGYVVSLIALRPPRFLRRLELDSVKDPSIEALMTRELTELDDPDPDGAQALRVMAMAHEYGVFIDASRHEEAVFSDVLGAISE